MPILQNNLVHDFSASPNTGQHTTMSYGTPPVVIQEDPELDLINQTADEPADLAIEPRGGSDFSLSNAAELNPNSGGDISPEKHDETVLTQDDIVIECGKSSEGVGERNNPFDRHILTQHVENEESPAQPNTGQASKTHSRSTSMQDEEFKSQTLKPQPDSEFFKDDHLKDTPSFVALDTDRGAELQNKRNSAVEDEDGVPIIEHGNKGSFESSNLEAKRGLS